MKRQEKDLEKNANASKLNDANPWPGKWNYRARIKSKNLNIHTLFASAIKRKMDEVEGLAWTEFEQKVINGLLEAASDSLKLIGLKPIIIDPEQIIILDQADFLKIKGAISNRNTSTAGFYSYGYIYLPRSEGQGFITTLAHELSHALSFYSLKVEEKTSNWGKTHYRDVNMAQIGLGVKTKKGFYYEGVNEALTEHWAKIMMFSFNENCSDLNLKVLFKEASQYWSYLPHVALIQEILTQGTQKRDNFFMDFFLAYFTGSSIDGLIKEVNPKLVKAIRRINGSQESLEKELKRVGAHDLLDKISIN